MSYYLEQHPNTKTAQYGWPRARVSGVIGVHTTESGVIPAGADPGAENTAGFIGRRTDHGSYHSLADWDTRLKLIRPRYAAWADITNNVHAMSVSGAMNAARWRDLSPERAAGIVRNMAIAAAELVQDAIADGLLDQAPPARRITAAEAIAGTKPGFYGHGETNPGTRYDPGQNFDWDLFLATYAAAIGGGINYASESITPLGTTTEQEEDEKMLVIASDSGVNDGKVWIGDGVTRRHIPNPEILATIQHHAELGMFKVWDGGKVQNLPQELLGQAVADVIPLEVNRYSTNLVNGGISNALIPEIRGHTAEQAERVLQAIASIPNVSGDLVSQLRQQILEAGKESAAAVRAELDSIEITLKSDRDQAEQESAQ